MLNGNLVLNVMEIVALWANRKRPSRLKVVAIVLVVQALGFLITKGSADAFSYLAKASLGDLAIVWLLSRYARTQLGFDVMCISAGCIVLHALGFIGYELKVPSVYYNTAIQGALAIQLVRMLIITKNDEPRTEDSSLPDMVRALGLADHSACHREPTNSAPGGGKDRWQEWT